MLDITDPYSAAFELAGVDDARVEQAATQGGVSRTLSVINDAIVEVRENLRINFEDDLTREGALARFIERHPYRLWTVGRQRCRIC